MAKLLAKRVRIPPIRLQLLVANKANARVVVVVLLQKTVQVRVALGALVTEVL